MSAAPTQTRKRVVVVFRRDRQAVEMTFPVAAGHPPVLPHVVPAALCSEDPPVITIRVEGASDVP